MAWRRRSGDRGFPATSTGPWRLRASCCDLRAETEREHAGDGARERTVRTWARRRRNSKKNRGGHGGTEAPTGEHGTAAAEIEGGKGTLGLRGSSGVRFKEGRPFLATLASV